ncbi:hypothetical protein AVEN_13137-1 [Araneus ventricosus]|uniref:Uncharacterized protein n=1 Tax=Araneus ventricosus TaxID=182803 RepID=A0A4Y2T751_ARAVE|nr:hypothetical protein AVEN_13137-1 [Araneus ventricosus]
MTDESVKNVLFWDETLMALTEPNYLSIRLAVWEEAREAKTMMEDIGGDEPWLPSTGEFEAPSALEVNLLAKMRRKAFFFSCNTFQVLFHTWVVFLVGRLHCHPRGNVSGLFPCVLSGKSADDRDFATRWKSQIRSVNVTLTSQFKATRGLFLDGPLNFEPQSDEEDAT